MDPLDFSWVTVSPPSSPGTPALPSTSVRTAHYSATLVASMMPQSAPMCSMDASQPQHHDERPLAGAAKASLPTQVLSMLGPLLMSKGKALHSSRLPAAAAIAQQDATRLLDRSMSASSGLTQYVNKMHISDALGAQHAKQQQQQQHKQPPPQQQQRSDVTPAEQQPPPHHTLHVAPAPAPPPQTPLDRLLEQARHCKLPPSPRGDTTAAAPAAAGAAAAAPTSSSTFGGVPHATVMLSMSDALPPRMQRAAWSLDDYVVGEKLYTGYASTVFKATCLRSGEVVVLKIYTLSAVCDLYKYQIYREIRVHSKLQHENVVHLYASFQQGEKIIMVEEYADGSDLFTLLHKYGGRLSERLAVQMVLDPFLRVLQYLHTRGIIHRDIKPENIMFTKNMCLKLGDFGLAIDLREERAVTRAGTLDYMAPEVLRCPFKSRPTENKEDARLHYNGRVDTWAVGVLTYELMVGFPPFFDQSRSGTEERILTQMPAFPSNMGHEAQDFVRASLAKNPLERPTILELLNHSWVDSYRTRRSMRSMESSAPTAAPAFAAAAPRAAAAAAAPPPASVRAVAQLPASMMAILSQVSSAAPPPPSPFPTAAALSVKLPPRAQSPTSTLMSLGSDAASVSGSSSGGSDSSMYMQAGAATDGGWPDVKAAPAAQFAGGKAAALGGGAQVVVSVMC